jgi:hypothetical protein
MSPSFDAIGRLPLSAAYTPTLLADTGGTLHPRRERSIADKIANAIGVQHPAIPYVERERVRRPDPAFDLESPYALHRILLERMHKADADLRRKIAIIYPPLPEDYVWTRQISETEYDFVNGGATFGIRYRPKHVEDLAHGEIGWRP